MQSQLPSSAPLLWAFTCLIVTVCAQEPVGYYTIVGSKFIRPHADYHVSVNLHDAAGPNSIRLTIQNSADANKLVKEVIVHPHSTESVVFQMADVTNGNYKVIAEGLSGVRFYNETELVVNTKRFVMLVQSDKAIYKPGDRIQFRVLVLDSNTKPIDVNGGLSIQVLDGRSNLIRQWPNATAQSGVFTGELQLSDYPVLGKWTIVVDMMGEILRRQIEVAEFVLPKFEVLIETEKNVMFKDGKIVAIIRGRYTFGKPVRGEAVITVQPKLHGTYQPLIGDLISRKVIKVVTKGIVEFDLVSDLKLSEEYERELVMDVTFEEEHTARKQNAHTTITVRRSQYKIAVVSPSISYMNRFVYKDGEAFQMAVQVSRHDAMPFVVDRSPIELSYNVDTSDGAQHTETSRLDSNGMARVSWVFPANQSGFYLRAKYMDLTDGLGYVSQIGRNLRSKLPNLRIKVLTQKPTLGEHIDIEIQSDLPINYITYQIIGRGDIIKAGSVKVPNVQQHQIQFLTTFAMVPKVNILVYHIVDGTIYYGSETILLDEGLQNTITLDESTKIATSGKHVELNIKTRPNSIVYLLAVDQRALSLRSGNDLTIKNVFDQLEDYYEKNENLKKVKRHYSDKFDQFGAFVLSNIFESNSVSQNRIEPIVFEDTHNHNHQHDVLTSKKTDIGPAHTFLSNTKPPLAGPYAFSRIPTSKWKRQRVLLESNLLDTWMFDSYQAGSDGILNVRKQVPDNTTSWVISAFALDQVNGLAITREPVTLKVFRKLVLKLNLPFSIKRGEVVSIPIVVLNYLKAAVQAEVTLYNEQQEFEFVNINNESDKAPKIELYRRKRVTIQPNDALVTTFLIKPKKVGPVNIKVTATHQQASDSINRILRVEHEGVPLFSNQAVLVDLRDKSALSSNVSIVVPTNAIPDSTRIQVSVAADLFGSTMQNLESLIRMPYGCGEQKVMQFASNIVLLNYMKQSGLLTAELEIRSKMLLESGYQRALNYRHSNGSFRVFESDPVGSIWMTAFVARSFRQAVELIDVEQRLIEEALQFLAGSQDDSGRFTEIGPVYHADMQGESSQGVALTAYTLIAFLENKSLLRGYRNVVNKAMDYIVRNLESLDVYALSVAAYALQLSQHNAKDFVLRSLDAKATLANGHMYWEKSMPPTDESRFRRKRPNSINTEMTAYALLAHLQVGGLSASAVQITRWLLTQRNAEGGFESTQDTLVGLQALAKVAEKLVNVRSDMQLALRYGDGIVRDFKLIGESSKSPQQEQLLPESIRKMNISATGHGIGVLTLSYKYNVNVTGEWPRFTVDPQVNRNSNSDYLHLTVCTSFIPTNDSKVSNMAVMEVNFPSGFTADLDTIPYLESTENVMKAETLKDETVMVIYFRYLGFKELCPTIIAFRTHKVAMQKPAAVTVYDYYDTGRRSRIFYRNVKIGVCDICEDECPQSCTVQAAERRADTPTLNSGSSASALICNFVVSIMIMLLIKTGFDFGLGITSHIHMIY